MTPLPCVPPLLAADGTGLVFGTFAAFFPLAAIAAVGLPERRGETLDDVDAESRSLVPA